MHDLTVYFYYGLLVAIALGAIYYNVHYDLQEIPSGEEAFLMHPEALTPESMCLGSYEPTPRRGTVVRYHAPGLPPEEAFLSRVVAVAGESVAVDGAVVTVNGEPLDEEAYRGGAWSTDIYLELVVPARCVFVLNDDRKGRRRGSDIRDSRRFGPIPLECITHDFGVRMPK